MNADTVNLAHVLWTNPSKRAWGYGGRRPAFHHSHTPIRIPPSPPSF
jgi:hypothetical protein